MENEDDKLGKFGPIIAELQALRNAEEEAEARKLSRAREFELMIDKAEWQEFAGSFDGFLKKFNICDSARYRTFVAAIEKPEIADATEIMGVSAAIEAAKIQDRGRRAKYIEAASVRRQLEGVVWSDQEAKKQRLQIAGSEPRDSKWNGKASELDRLREENIALKKEVQALRRENEELKAAANPDPVPPPVARKKRATSDTHAHG